MAGHRRSIRLRGYDYSRGGVYFLTICVDRGRCLLENLEVRRMVQSIWDALPRRFPRVKTDAFVIMPNHVHAIMILSPRIHANRTSQADVEAANEPPSSDTQKTSALNTGLSASSLSDVVYWFKSFTTTRYRDGVRQYAWQQHGRRLWQRNYYERIIRNDDELFRIREYIDNNPRSWGMDRENPDRIGENDVYDSLYS